MRSNLWFRRAVVGVIVVLSAGCEVDPSLLGPARPREPARPRGRATRWAVTPRPVEAAVGDTVRLQITLYDANDDTLCPCAEPGWVTAGAVPLTILRAPHVAAGTKIVEVLLLTSLPGEWNVLLKYGYSELGCEQRDGYRYCGWDLPRRWTDLLPPLVVRVRVQAVPQVRSTSTPSLPAVAVALVGSQRRRLPPAGETTGPASSATAAAPRVSPLRWWPEVSGLLRWSWAPPTHAADARRRFPVAGLNWGNSATAAPRAARRRWQGPTVT